jgi:hypothetical protein
MENTYRLSLGNIMAFILAGNAIFTIVNPVTGNRFTYRVTQKTDDGGRKTPHFVSVLTGANNESDYTYIGFIRNSSQFIYGGSKAKAGKDALSVRAFTWFWGRIGNPSPIEVYHEGRCGRCGRKLTVPESIVTGYGPECSEMLGMERDRQFKVMFAKREAEQERKAYESKMERDAKLMALA